ncbi:MAG: preprotein translocase subunit SecE [Thermoflexales bacterium]|nr:preprotein translocase subunit SecE [Thermoflexales bacterium]MDW8350895.1 preprotein translocase subunit SecE [Anaerolineae bacterium]
MANQDVAEKKSSGGLSFLEPAREYIRETLGELRKVHWPTRTDARNLTTVVLAVTLVMAAFLGLFDFLFGRLIEEILVSNVIAIAIAVVIVLSIIVLVVFASRDYR